MARTELNLMGQRVMWCPACNDWFKSPPKGDDPKGRDFDWTCPRCHTPIRKLKCTRCGYIWTPTGDRLPTACAKCKTPYWNRTRVM